MDERWDDRLKEKRRNPGEKKTRGKVKAGEDAKDNKTRGCHKYARWKHPGEEQRQGGRVTPSKGIRRGGRDWN